MEKTTTGLLLVGSILASIGGVSAFLFLFLRDFNVFTLIVAPVILACYQAPAALLFWLYRRRKQHERDQDEEGDRLPEP
jgi:hypothetical protein